MNFDEIIDRRGTHSAKWDAMEKLYGVSPETGISMWVADMDFRPPATVQKALEEMTAHGVYGYYADDSGYRNAICWWMEERHGWQVAPDTIFTVSGLVNGTALCLDTFTEAGDGIVLFTPVYHAFARTIRNAGRKVVECELAQDNGRYSLDIENWDAQMTGTETMAILCSPHNPGGRVWTAEELRAIADFCVRHDLMLVSDEIHHDLVFDGHKHIPMAKAAPEIADRLVMMTAPSKTFNLAGPHTGQVIIADHDLRARFAARMAALGMASNSFGLTMTEAAYSPGGVEWLGALLPYLDQNRALFDAAIAEIPGLKSMELESTYLAWVNFADTGMDMDEINKRVAQEARIAANHGTTFGKGGESFLRFNLATPRARVEEACERLKSAFADLQ